MSQILLDPPPQQAPATPAATASARRSKKRDGRGNRLQFWALTHLPWLWRALQSRKRTERLVNRVLIDLAVGKAPPRPYALSTKGAYTGWASLTDKTYNARQLPPAPARTDPPPEQVAELFRRGDEALLCPKSTVLFAHLAQWFTDGFLRTKRPEDAEPGGQPPPRDISRNISTHEVDLSQVYGSTPEVTAALRANEGGRMKSEIFNGEELPPLLCDASGIKAEFADLDPVIGFEHLTPEQKRALFAMGSDVANAQIGYSMFNVLFLREHNRIAGELQRAYGWDDDERLFQTTRAILTVLLIRLAIEEYINHIAPYHFKFKLRPGSFERSRWMRPNWESVEFNLLYRWHSLIPDTMRVDGQDLSIGETTFRNDLLFAKRLGPLFAEASGQRACQIGLFNTATYFFDNQRNTMLASVRQARAVNLASYNDYRALVGLPRVTDFDQISSRREVREALQATYGHVDDIEFYVGLFAEDNRKNSAIGPLTGTLVGVHAFSQLMTNPLLAPNVFVEETFSPLGWKMIHEPLTLQDLLNRNVADGSPPYSAQLTREGWQRE